MQKTSQYSVNVILLRKLLNQISWNKQQKKLQLLTGKLLNLIFFSSKGQQNLWFNPNLSYEVTFSPESNGALEIVKPPFGSWVRLNVVAIISPPAGFVTNGILSVILNGNLWKLYNFNGNLLKLYM